MDAELQGIKFTDADIANPDDFIPAGAYNPHKVHGFLLHDHGFTVAVVFASNLQDALDIAVDEGKMEAFQLVETDLGDYGPDGEGISYLGNAGEPHDIESLSVLEFDPPPFSFVALYNAANG
jgi:hypothetical protein